jgi:hypothetical protein
MRGTGPKPSIPADAELHGYAVDRMYEIETASIISRRRDPEAGASEAFQLKELRRLADLLASALRDAGETVPEESDADRARRLREGGLRWSEIAALFGRTERCVWGWVTGR